MSIYFHIHYMDKFLCYFRRPEIHMGIIFNCGFWYFGIQDLQGNIIDETDIRVNDVARVYSGVLMGMEGEVVDVKNRYAILMIPSLGLQMQVKVPKENIQVLRRKKAN